jgi:hypothetical protein
MASSWVLQGRVTPGASPHPDAPPFAGGKTLIGQCGSIRPCAAERWVQEGHPEVSLQLLRRGSEIYREDGTKWSAQWWTISGLLRACIGDPLSVPPTTDPEAYRTLLTTPTGGMWTIHLSGKNPCGLEGQLHLYVNEDKLELHDLRCGGEAWKKGGRECAMARRAAAMELSSERNKAGD